MITPAFSLTATERVLPRLALDFTTANLDSRVTFNRTTSASNPATYVNSSGLLALATNNQPRFDFNPATLICKGLLIEESRTNILLYSNDFSNAAWTLTSATLGATTTSPDGTSNAVLVDVSANAYNVRRTANLATTGTYAMSVYLKAGSVSSVNVFLSISTLFRATFNLSTGAVSAIGASLTTAYSENAGNGWWRCTVVGAITSVTAQAGFGLSTTGTFYAYGAQQELGAFATSYIPTEASALTRNADVATMTGTNFSDWYNQPEGALSCEFAFIGYDLANRDRMASITDATGNEEIGIIQNSTNGYGRFEVVDGGANQALLNCINTTMVAGTTYQICGTYKINSFCGSGSLGSQATDASGTIPTPDRMCIGGNGPGTTTAIFNGHMKSINYWPQRITNNETLAFAKI
jgi:hypothetical protein